MDRASRVDFERVLRARRVQRRDEDETVKREDVTDYPISRFAYTAMKKARGLSGWRRDGRVMSRAYAYKQ